jgi:hypothetical protein
MAWHVLMLPMEERTDRWRVAVSILNE